MAANPPPSQNDPSTPNRHHQMVGPANGYSNISRSSTFLYSSPSPVQQQNGASRTASPQSSVVAVSRSSPSSSSAASSSAAFSPPAFTQTRPKPGKRQIPPPQMQQQQQQQYIESAESECLEHYESNLEKYKDERDAIQKKTFTKWVNQHLMKSGKRVEDLFVDLRDGNNLIDLLQSLSGDILLRENGLTRFHRIQNLQSSLEFLRRRNIKLVNIRPEDIVDGNGKLTLGLIWTIILNFQVSAVINQRHPAPPPIHDISLRVSASTSTQSRTQMMQQTMATSSGAGSSHSVQRTISESVYQHRHQTPSVESQQTLSARDALLAWARRITNGYPDVNVTNFSGSWKDGLAFCSLLHYYRPDLANWEKLTTQSTPGERLRFAFDTLEREYGIAKLLDPEDVCDVGSPDERSLITYVSLLHNRLVHEPKGSMDDLVSRLTRGIGITNEKLDHILVRIDAVDAAAERGERVEILERQIREIVDDLHALKPPIDDFFVDVETLRQHRHPEANDFNKQVMGLEQRRTAYLGRLEDGIMVRLGIGRQKAQFIERFSSATSQAHKGNAFRRVEDAIQWVREKMYKLNTMQFSETLEVLEQMFEQHKLDNRDIQDFRQTVDECIARQAEVSAEDSYDYCELLKILESEYQQLRELSAGRMVDLDSLIAFIRAAQLELVWIHEREELEVTRNWSDVQHLDIPMLQNYFKQLLHEIELHEKQFNDVHNQGAALINQRHPAGEVIEVYLRTMQNQWDWLLNLSKCLEGHLRDAYNAKAFMEEADQVEQQVHQQLNHMDQGYNRTEFSLDEGERMLRELDSIREHIQQLHARLLSLTERCAQISPLWQRGERIGRSIPVMALCEYKSKEIHIRQGDECTLVDNHDLLQWRVRGMDGVEASVPSVVFRIPPPDPRLANLLSRLHGQFEKLRKMWDRKHHLVRYNMVLNTMRTVRGWDLDTFLSIPPDQRDEIIKALNEDVNKLLAELDPNDPLARRLKDELRLTNEHFYDLLARAQKGPEPDYSNEFDHAAAELIRKFEEAWKVLSERAQVRIPANLDELEQHIREHKIFEDALQALDVDVSNVKELFRQLPNPTPNQRAKSDLMISRWEEIWDLCRMYVERLKALENVLKSVDEVTDIVRRHEITLSSFDDMPAALERLRGVHAQLVELNMVLQQQGSIVENLNKDTAQIRSHVARTRLGVQHHPDVDQLEDIVTSLTMRWDNVNSQVTERLRVAEEAQQTQMVYRSQYEEELQWLDRVEATINSLRRPEELRPEELQGQLDQLTAEYAQLQEHTATIENINKEGGKFIRDARSYDIKLAQYHDNTINFHGQKIKEEFRRQVPQPKNGAQIVTEELEALNRRFAQLSSVILERKNIVNVLIQNWRRKQQEAIHTECLRRSAEMHSLMAELGQLERVQQEQLRQFALNSAEETREARQKFVEVRNQLNGHAPRIDKIIAEADRLCIEGADSLSPEQFHLLKESRQRLHGTFESLLRQADSVLARLDLATALLLEFTARTSAFQSWVYERGRHLDSLRASSGDPNRLEESRRAFRTINEQILSKRPELCGISQLATRIESEIDAYVNEISGRRGREGTPLQQEHHQIRETAQRAQEDYDALLISKQELDQMLRRLGNCSMQYEQRLGEANGWLAELERAISHGTLGATSGGDIESRLANLLRLNQNAVEGQPKIEMVEVAARQLDDAAAQTDSHERLQAEHEEELGQLRRKYSTLSDRLKDGMDAARTEMTQREGLAQGLVQLQSWLGQMERKVGQTRRIPLNPVKLSELKYEDQLERSELESKEKTLAELGALLRARRPMEDLGGAGAELEKQFGNANERLRRVGSATRAHSDNLRDAVKAYEEWQREEAAFSQQLATMAEAIGELEAADMARAEQLGQELTALEANEWTNLQQLARRMMDIPNVEGMGQIVEKMRSHETMLGRLRNALGAKLNSGHRLAQRRNEFWQKAQQIGNELGHIEERIRTNSTAITADPEESREKRRECGELGERLANVQREMDGLDGIGSELIQQGGGGTNKRGAGEGAGGDEKGGDPVARITRQLFELHRREEEAQRALAHLNGQIEEHDSAIMKWHSERDGLSRWVEAERAGVGKLWNALMVWEPMEMGEARMEAEKGTKRMRQEQPKMTQLQLKCRQLVGGENGDGTNGMDNLIGELEKCWDGLEADWVRMDKCMGRAETVLRDAQREEKWLEAKQQLLVDTCAGVAAADAKLVEAQMNIAKMLQSELADERHRWIGLNDDASEAVQLAQSQAFSSRIVARMDQLNRKWRQFEESLGAQMETLGEAKKQIADFERLQRDLVRDLRALESMLNESASLRPGQSEQKARLAEAESRLERELRPALGQMRIQAENIQKLLAADAALRSDLDDRVDGTERTMDELKAKLQSVKKAAESASAAEEELNQGLSGLVNWVQCQKGELDKLPGVSAEPNRLLEQIDQFRGPYSRILAKEGEVIVAGSKAASVLSQSPSAELKRKLLTLNEIWPPLLAAAKERQEKLERAKKALDELVDTERDTKEALANLRDELAAIKTSEKENVPAMESIQQRLHALGPCVDSAFALMDKLERVTGGGGAETKKHRLALEQLRRDYAAILADCTNGLEQAKAKESLRARFDSEADSLQSMLDTYKSTLGLEGATQIGQKMLDMNGNAGAVGKDALKLGIAEFDSRWAKGIRQLQSTINRLKPKLDTKEANLVEERSEELGREAKWMREEMGAKLAEFEKGEDRQAKLLERGRALSSNIAEFVDKIASLPGIGREQIVLAQQSGECEQLGAELESHSGQMAKLEEDWAEMGSEEPNLHQMQLGRMEMERAQKQLERQRGQLEMRANKIGEMHQKLDKLDTQMDALLSSIGTLSASGHLGQPLGTEIAALTGQKDGLKGLKAGEMAELAERKAKREGECKELIRSAGPNVGTEKLEAHLGAVNTAWQSLSASVEGRERELDGAIQALGSIHEAQQSLLNWLEQTEELLADQRPPAADHKVVRAQLQNLDFQRKLVNEKRPNVDGFLELVNKLATNTDQRGQANQLKLAGEHIGARYNELVEGVDGRHRQLEAALVLSQHWAQLHQELGHFLAETEKGMHAFERIPTDARRMDEQIGLQATLQVRTEAQRENVERFVELSEQLCQIVGIEDGQEVDAKMHQLVGRYDGLGQKLRQCSQVMSTIAEDISTFLGTTAQLAEWLDRAEGEIQQFNDLPIEPDELSKQSEDLVDFVNDVATQAQLLENVIEISRELCAHTSGSEALTLQFRTDQLKQRYNMLTDEADAKIVLWEKALPLAENYKEGVRELKEHLEGVEEDMDNLGQVTVEEQFQLVATIESDLGPAREQLEAIQAIGVELQRLTTEERANELAKGSAELVRRFNAVADAVARKADQLRQAERQSRLTFDVLDFWIDWFNEVQEQIVQAEKPAVDIEQLKGQLRQQRQMNEEIGAERNGLREMIGEASKVARELSSTLGGQEGQEALLAKVERAKKLAEVTAELGAERTAELEQAFALCKDLDAEYTEMNEWMDGLERELRACQPITTGMPAKALLAQQQHNNAMLQQIQNQRPMVAKFERNVGALSELCAEADEQNLKQIAENVAERFDELTGAFRERGDVLTASLEQSSQLGDRLNMFLSNLASALDQLRAQEPPSCRPPVLRRQMAEMGAIFELLRQKEASFLAMKAQGQEMMRTTMMAQDGSGQQIGGMNAEVQQRLEELDHRWLELNSGAEVRQNQLESLLPVAERFWVQLDRAQQTIGHCRQQCDQVGSSLILPLDNSAAEQLQSRHAQMQHLQSAIEECAANVHQTNIDGLELCRGLNAEDEQSFVQQHLAALQAQWDAFMAHHAQLSGSLSMAMDQSFQFHGVLQQLAAFLAEKQAQADALLTSEEGGEGGPSSSLSVEAIREQLQIVDGLRRELDDAALSKEQLNQMGAEICAHPSAINVASSIRQPLAELNQRWNRLYGQLGDGQHRLERALLDMGQFAQANDQLMAWMDKTQATLANVDPKPSGGLKHVEIELCKLRVLQNDIGAHQPSYEAILATGRQMLRQDPQCAASTQPMLDNLAQRWAKLVEQSEQIWVQLERARGEAASRGNDLDKWQLWMADLLAELKSTRPVGGLPETAAAQLDEFRVVQADVEQRRPEMEECLRRLEAEDDEGGGEGKKQESGGDDWMRGQCAKLKADWAQIQEKLAEREKRLRQALEDALELARGMQEMQDWLQQAEGHLAMVPPTSKLIRPLEEQLARHRQFHDEVQEKSQFMKELGNKGVRMQLSCEKKDAIPMKNRLVSLKHRADKLLQKSNERLGTLTQALDESRQFFNGHRELMGWIGEQQKWVEEKEAEKMGTGERIRELLDEHRRRLMEQIQRRAGLYENTRLNGDLLGEYAPAGEKHQIEEANEELRQKWVDLGKSALKRQKSLEEALIQSGRFEEVLGELLDWLHAKLPPLENEMHSQNYFGDIETMNALMREHFELVEQADARRGNVQNVLERAAKIMETEKGGDPQELGELAEKRTKLDDQWGRLEGAIGEQDQRFTAALKKAVDLSEMMHELDSALQDIEGRVRRLALPWSEPGVLGEQEQLEKLRRELAEKRPELERLLELARELQGRAHPRAEQPMRELVRQMGGRWELLEQLMGEKGEKLRNRLEEIRQHERKLDELLGFVEEKQGQLDLMRDNKDESQLGRLHTFMDEEQMFRTDLQQRQPELEEALKMAGKRQSLLGIASLASVREEEEEGEREGGVMEKSQSEQQPKSAQRRESQGSSPTKRGSGGGSKLKLQEKAAPQSMEQAKMRRKSDQLGEGWRKLWNELVQYGDHLKQRKAYLDEMERLRDFTFEEWRERYLAWNDHGKARVSDLFRRIDKSGTGMVPRKLFIDGILASKFATTELEMGKVADEFDKGDGLISAREFMNALRYDPKKMRRGGRQEGAKTETERIHEEIARETAKCTCAHRFPIQHISTEKDRVQYGFGFGGSMKRMVRILRSTVMVRVGGGWEALDGFLAKHDPCRAKGRINVDLLPLTADHHIRPLGAIDRMEEFHVRRKDSSGSSATSSANAVERLLGYSPGQPGPIMKIREKTDRSMPMFKRPLVQPSSSNGAGTSQHRRRGSDHSIIDDIYGSSRIPRPPGSRLGSDLGSNPSRPASRGSDAGSDFGASTGSGTRIPSYRAQKGVRFAGLPGSGASGRNTPSAHSDA